MSDDDTFTLSIKLGNQAMLTAVDVADALESVAGRIRRGDYWPGHTQSIRDYNGNRVGSYRLPPSTDGGDAGHWDDDTRPDMRAPLFEAVGVLTYDAESDTLD